MKIFHYLLAISILLFSFESYAQLSGIHTVGSGGTYSNFKGAGGVIQTINNDAIGLNGNLIIEVISDITETGSNQTLDGTKLNGFTLTIRPNSATTRTITLNNGGIHLQNCDNITIDGSFGGSGRFLTFINPVDNGEVFEIDTRGSNLTFENCTFESNADGTTEGALDFAVTTDVNGYDNITINNNLFRDATGQNTMENAIYISEPSTADANHENIVISNNDFELEGRRSILLDRRANSTGTIFNISIIGNNFYATSTVTLTNREEIIRVEEADSLEISGNFFGGTATGATGGNAVIDFGTENRFRAIFFTNYIDNTSINVIDNNVFRNFQFLGTTTSACDAYMLYLTGGINHIGSTTGNTFGSITADATTNPSIELISRTNGSDLGMIYTSGDNNVQIENNIVGGLRLTSDQLPSTYGQMTNIYSTGNSEALINNNTIGSSTQPNNLLIDVDRHFYGIYTNNQQTVTITNNTIAGFTANGDFGNVANAYAIRSSNASPKVIQNNVIGSSSVNSTTSPNITIRSNAGDCSFYGVYANGSGTTMNISNNSVGGIYAHAANSTESNHVYCIYTNNNQTGVITINANNIGSNTTSSNIYTTSRGLFRGIQVNSDATTLTIDGNNIQGISTGVEFGDRDLTGIIMSNRNYSDAVNVTNNIIGNTTADATTSPSIDAFIGYADASPNYVIGLNIQPATASATNITDNTIAGIRVTSASVNERSYFRGISTNRNPNTTWTISNNLIGSNSQVNSIVQETNLLPSGIYSTGQGTHIFDSNTIRGFKSQGFANGDFRGIYHNESVNSNVTVTNNIIGNTTVDASTSPNIDLNANNSSGSVYPAAINIREGINVNISNNTIGGIRLTSTAGTELQYFRGIYHGQGASTGNVSISTNTIGSSTQDNNVFKSSAGSIYGIYQGGSAVTGTLSFSSNTIGGIGTNGSFDNNVKGIYATSTSSATDISFNSISNCGIINGSSSDAIFTGIHFTNGTNTVDNNTIDDITINSQYSGGVFRGVHANEGSTGQTISNNTISNISLTAAINNNARGINVSTSGSGGNVFNNIISGFTHNSSTNHALYGIYTYDGDWNFYNNVILFGDGITSNTLYCGIYHRNNTGSSSCNYWYNTVEIEGTVSSGNNTTYAFWRSNNANNVQLRNNLFTNNRNGGSGSHYAIRNQLTSANWDCDHNSLYSSNAATVGQWGNTAHTFATWQTASSQDANSNSASVTVDATGMPTTSTDWAAVDGFGTPVSVTVDYIGQTRDPSAPYCGAYERFFSWTAGDVGNKTDWFDIDNWSSGTIPTQNDNVLIPTNPTGGNFFPNINTAGAVCNNLTIETNASVEITGTNNLDVHLGWYNDGTFTCNQSTVNFVGSNDQSITSSSNEIFHNITLNNSSNLDIDASTTIDLIGTLTLTSGTLNTNGNLTLISDASGTARIAEITGGAISGDITMQRYIDAGATNWRFLTSAVANSTLTQYNDDFITSGFTGSDFPNWPTAGDPWESIYFYDETIPGIQDNGFVAATNITNSVTVGEGLWVWSGDTVTGTQPFTIDMTGPTNTGNINLPVSYTNTPHADDGWNMVGNPYPSTIDWDDNTNITKTNINDAIYIWNPDLQQFASYVGGVGLNGGSQYIASSQGFWVQASGSSPVLQVREGSKTANTGAFLKSRNNSHLTIHVANSYGADETILKIEPNATKNFDGHYDALKMNTTVYGLPNICSVLYDSIEYSINQIPNFGTEIPIKIITTASGLHNISFTGISNLSNASCLVLEDLFTGLVHNLNTNQTITAYISDTTTIARYILKIGIERDINATPPSCSNTNDGTITFNKPGSTYDITWKDAQENVIASNFNVQGASTLNNLSSGTFTIETTDLICGNNIDVVSLTQPNQITSSFTTNSDTVYISNGGHIQFNNLSSNASYYEWDFNDENTSTLISPNHIYNQAGTYNVSLKAFQSSSCFDTYNKLIYVLDQITSVQENNPESNFEAWIANNILTVAGEHIERVEIRNLVGQLVMSKPTISANNFHIINLGQISSQTLIVSVLQEENLRTIKLNHVNK